MQGISAFTTSGPAAAPTERQVPVLDVGIAGIVAVLLFAIALGGWEYHWRDFGSVPSYQNSDDAWAAQRRRIDEGEHTALVLLGASRVLFGVQLHVWERLSGVRPIQLAVEGTSPLPVLEDLADDDRFRGRLLVGVAPDVFFTGFLYRGGVLDYHQRQTPSQRAGHWLSARFIEPFFAFFDPDYALMTVLRRQAWPSRAGVPSYLDVRKLSVSEADRNTHLWAKVEHDPEYRGLAQHIWAQFFDVPPPGINPEDFPRIFDEQISRSAAAVAKLHARGVDVIFVRPPSNGRYLEFERRDFPRDKTWDQLLERTGAPGIHFEDYPEMQGLHLPEWSHLSPADAERYTEALYRRVEDIGRQSIARGAR